MLSQTSETILKNLRRSVEGAELSADGKIWGSVYLDNAVPEGMSKPSFAGHLGALAEAGFYRPQGDGCFGLVLIEE